MNTGKVTRREFLKKSAITGAALSLGAFGFPAIVHAKITFKVGYLPILDHLALAVSHARDNDSFRKLSTEPKFFKKWTEVAGALNAGVVDAGFLLSNYAMDEFGKGSDIRTILIGHRNGSGIVVAQGSGIDSPSALAGKTIAIPAAISTHTALLYKYLSGSGLSLKDVTTRVVAPPDMPKALNAGSIDAYIVAEPFVAKAEIDGAGKVLVLSKDILKEHICCVVVVRSEVLRTNPEGIQEWVESLIRSGKFIDRDKVENAGSGVLSIGSKYLGHSEKVIAGGLLSPVDRITYSDLNPRKSDYQAILDLSVKTNIMGKVDLDRFIDRSFYEKAKV